MKNINIKAFLFILISFSGIVWFIVAKAIALDTTNIFHFLRPIPQVVFADVFLIAMFSQWCWRWNFFQGWLVPFPDLNGTWQGEIQTNWQDEDGNTPGPIPTVLSIKQSFWRISCVMRTVEMESYSYVEGFYLDTESQIRKLSYSYNSRPKVSLRNRSTPHDGTILFNIIGKPVRKMEGEYWTQRETTGIVNLTFRTKELLDEVPADLFDHAMSLPTIDRTNSV